MASISKINLIVLLYGVFNVYLQLFFFQHQGEAKSAQLIGEAIANNKSFIALRKIEAAREIAQRIGKSQNRVLLNSDELLLNLESFNLEKK